MSVVFFSAGESSGDLHGANLIEALREADGGLEFEGLGGARMSGAGMRLIEDVAGRGVMGFWEVVKSFGWIRRVFVDTVRRLEEVRPACLVVIDYPGFNIRLARAARGLGIPVVYYVSPQVWAWKKGRIHTIAKLVDKMLVILPFEEGLYRSVGVACAYVGHPLLDEVARFRPRGLFKGDCVVGLLPGSREQEIARLMGPMVEVARGIRERHPGARFVAPCVDAVREAQIRVLAGGFELETVVGQSYEVLSGSRFCLVASGTATLEAAIFGAPMVIMYRTSRLNYWIARHVVKIKHIGLVNILAGREIVPEFIQGRATAGEILPHALELIEDTERRRRMVEDLRALRSGLGEPGASRRAAQEILGVMRGTSHG